MSSCELVRYFDYPCDISHATTEDGYVIEVIRVPHGLRDNGTAPNAESGTARHPVLFVPVFAGASDLWFINYPSQSAGMYLISFRRRVPCIRISLLLSVCRRWLRRLGDEFEGSGALLEPHDYVQERPRVLEVQVDLVVAYGPVANVSHMGPPLSLGIPFTPLITLDRRTCNTNEARAREAERKRRQWKTYDTNEMRVKNAGRVREYRRRADNTDETRAEEAKRKRL
ncbi:hypothetical protein HPB51_006831 [Rhipicephalus microplus]|uniref:Partial AB-hydrolase lipase domain-containing protein n=1 Tax=Rhipicephalus microplus TaxID=6941 RepID=A0A9J6E7R6_RHIMP|nr:hypothetical protein HPB51_006831 [Rhipicephalus microplus]